MLLLASKSPRRKEILSLLGVPFEARAADIDESETENQAEKGLIRAEDAALRLAETKLNSFKNTTGYTAVISADTVVAIENTILGKPQSNQDAVCILESLRNRQHSVVSAVAVYNYRAQSFASGYRVTKVNMRNYTGAEIKSYIETGEPFDKAGAYGIQGKGSRLVDSIEGDYLNVVGMSIVLLCKLLNDCSVPLISG